MLIADLHVDIVLASHFLGGGVGNEEGERHYVRGKVEDWVEAVTRLATAARTYPQSAHTAFAHSLSSEWNYVQ